MKKNLIEFMSVIKENNAQIEKCANEIANLLQSCKDQECKEKIGQFNILIMARTMTNSTTFLGIETCIKNIEDKPGEKVW